MRRIRAMAAAAAALLAAGGATAQDSPADWLKRPSADDLLAVWPRAALKRGIGGEATIQCVATVQGTLRQCRVLSEKPIDGGFGSAALVLSQQFQMRPARKSGLPVESLVTIPVNFPRPDRATGSHLRPSTDTDFPGERVATSLPWREAPSYADLHGAYPAKARAAKVSGVVTLDCALTKAGRLTTCRELREEPRGHGFGAAARSLAPKFLGPTQDAQGKPLGRLRTHVTFAFSPDALESPNIRRPRWIGLPTPADFAALLPPAARAVGVFKARVVMMCQVVQSGGLGGCRVDSEEPGGLGYADAALALSRSFVLNTWTDEGLPTIGGTVRVPIRFDLTPSPANAPAAP